MNYVDSNFKWLMNRIREKSEEDLYQHMKEKYDLLPNEIKDSMEHFLSDFGYWGKLDSKNGEYEEIRNKAISFHEHPEDFEWLYNRLNDYRSKKLLFGILYNWYDYDFNTLKELMDTTFCHYFDLDLIKCENEVFVDIGAYIGDTTLDFIHSFGENSYRKIYCYEMTPSTFEELLENTNSFSNIDCRNKAISEQKEILHMSANTTSSSANTLALEGNMVEAVSLDEDISEKITMIKMDIEGAEEKALMGAVKHIQRDHPKLLISVYHNHEDLWKVPKMIEEICPGYTFYLRFYGSNIFPTEIVLFGIYED